jgi:hypothetical protein
MDFKDQIKQLADRISKIKEQVLTEEATKTAFIMPMLQTLGYDVFNPSEIVPEFVADIGTKKGEKIDYAILNDGKPLILVECKHWQVNLKLHEGQLLRYFQAAKARFGILTNGTKYQFYSDLEKDNIMDEKPFFEFDILDIKENQIEELKKFHKSYFDLNNIFETASELKYTSEIKTIIQNEMNNPSEWFVSGIAKVIYSGRLTTKILEQFTALTKKSFGQLINDLIADRLKIAATKQEEAQIAATQETTPENEPLNATDEELEIYFSIRALLHKYADNNRFSYKKYASYLVILLDNNIRKPIIRIYPADQKRKILEVFDDFKNSERYEYTKLQDIFDHLPEMIESIEIYDNKRQPDPNKSRKKKPNAENQVNPAE